MSSGVRMASYYPQYSSSGLPPRQSPPPSNVSTMGTVTIVLALCLTAVYVAQGVAGYLAGDQYAAAARQGRPALDVATWADALVVVQVPLLIGAYAATCVWLYRARANAQILSPHLHHRRSPAWVWLGWWMPVVSAWFPYQVVRDVRSGSIRNRPPQAFLGLWWLSFLVLITMDRVVARLTSSTAPLTQQRADHLAPVHLVFAAVALIAGMLWVGVVAEITDNQTK